MSVKSANNQNPTMQLETHMIFVCPECGIEFRTQQSWRKHLNTIHDYRNKGYEDFDFKEVDERFHECQSCYKWVEYGRETIALLQYHRFIHLPFSETYRCLHCRKSFARKRALCDHLTSKHTRELKLAEEHVNKVRTISQAAKKNAPKHENYGVEFFMRYICPQCGKLIEKFSHWLHHINTAHRSTSVDLHMNKIPGTRSSYCFDCKKICHTKEKALLQQHRFSHLPYKVFYKCAYCTYKKNTKGEILRHFIQMHDDEFQKHKDKVKKPTEWGKQMCKDISNELDLLLDDSKMEDDSLYQQQQNDERGALLQRALLRTLIDSEDEDKPTKKTNFAAGTTKSNNAKELALDESLHELEAIMRQDMLDENETLNSSIETYDAEELDRLCEELFEEIEDVPEKKQENSKTEIKMEDEVDEPEEQIISIEIDAVRDDDELLNVVKEYHTESKVDENILHPLAKRRRLTSHSKSVSDKSLLENNIKYLCPECGKEYAKLSEWRKHVFSVHDLANVINENFKMLENHRSFLCLDCIEVQHTTKTSDLQRHYFTHLPYRSYLKCKFCGRTKSSKLKIIHHLQSNHGSELGIQTMDRNDSNDEFESNGIKCENCQKRFQCAEYYQSHQKFCNSRRAISFSNSENLRLLTHLKQARARIRKLSSGKNPLSR